MTGLAIERAALLRLEPALQAVHVQAVRGRVDSGIPLPPRERVGEGSAESASPDQIAESALLHPHR